MRYEAFEDKLVPGQWRVEAINHDDDGECYVTIFTGPESERRAKEYASLKNGSALANAS